MILDAWLFAAAGTMQAGVGAFFILVRPPLLPEDLRFLGQTTAEISERVPRLGKWLRWVFIVLGGHAAAAGGLTVFVAMTAVRQGDVPAIVALALSGAASMGLMAAVNFAIRSAFRWLLLGFALLWVAAIVAAVVS